MNIRNSKTHDVGIKAVDKSRNATTAKYILDIGITAIGDVGNGPGSVYYHIIVTRILKKFNENGNKLEDSTSWWRGISVAAEIRQHPGYI